MQLLYFLLFNGCMCFFSNKDFRVFHSLTHYLIEIETKYNLEYTFQSFCTTTNTNESRILVRKSRRLGSNTALSYQILNHTIGFYRIKNNIKTKTAIVYLQSAQLEFTCSWPRKETLDQVSRYV